MILNSTNASLDLYFPRNLESRKVSQLVPDNLRAPAENLIEFIQSYYDWMNSSGLPSREVNSITANHDIDRVSLTYLDAIQSEIAKSVPNSKVLDRVSLYKKIVKYYSTRGSGDSVMVFFRIFFDEMVEIFYPKDYLFSTSSGDWNESIQRYDDRKGFSSDYMKLRDGYYWQEFSYDIRSSLNIEEWQNEFMKMVHPAGLKLFASLILTLFRSNVWENSPTAYDTTNPVVDVNWLRAFVPNNANGEFHMPSYQPGWLSGDTRRVGIFLETLFWNSRDANNLDFYRAVIITLGLNSTNDKISRNSLVRDEFITSSSKFWGTGSTIGSWSSCTIQEAGESYSEFNTCQFINLPAFITRTVAWNDSVAYYGNDIPPPAAGWNNSYTNFETGGTGDHVGYDSSYFGTL